MRFSLSLSWFWVIPPVSSISPFSHETFLPILPARRAFQLASVLFSGFIYFFFKCILSIVALTCLQTQIGTGHTFPCSCISMIPNIIRIFHSHGCLQPWFYLRRPLSHTRIHPSHTLLKVMWKNGMFGRRPK